MAYGLPYQGSKNVIAERILKCLPSGTNFVDCCCGGGAILQAAVESGKYKTVTGYDINKSIIGLLKAVMVDGGCIDYEHFQMVTKDKFYEARDRNATLEDWLIRYTCSFGFKGTEYLWGESRMKWKTLTHNAVALPTVEERRNALRDLLTLIAKDKPDDAELKNMCHIDQLTNLNRIREVEMAMQSMKTKTKLQVFCKSMFDIPFENFDVIYFDPPYSGTTPYNRSQFSQIMFKTLLKVLTDSGKLVFVSEYNQPCEGFTEIASFQKTMTLIADETRKCVEKLFFGGTLEQYKSLGLEAISEPCRIEDIPESSEQSDSEDHRI